MSTLRPVHLAFLALAAGLFIPFLSLPPFALGYWEKAEPLVVALHAVAAIAALALAWEGGSDAGGLSYRLRQPVVAAPAAIGVLSLALAPLTELPVLSLLGAPQSGQGGLWFLDMAVLAAAAAMVRENSALWRRLYVVAVIAALGIAALKGWDWYAERTGRPHLLIWVAAYYGWLAAPLLVLTADLRPAPRLLKAGALAAAILVIVASRNATAMAAAVPAAILAGAAWLPLRKPGGDRLVRWSGIAAVTLLMVAVPLALMGVGAVHTIASLDDRRSLLAMLARAAEAGRGQAWLTGNGWGRVQDTYQAQLTASGQRLWDDSWIFMQSDYFHAHNVLAEAFNALGVVGVVLMLALAAAPLVGSCRSRLPVACGFAVWTSLLGSLWFSLALSLPATAMALAVFTRPMSPIARVGGRRSLLAALLAALSLAQLASAAALYRQGVQFGDFRQQIARHIAVSQAVPTDFRGGDLAVAEILRDTFNHLETVGAPEPQALSMARELVSVLHQRIPTTVTPLLPVTGLSLMAQSQMTDGLPWLADMTGGVDAWRTWLDRALLMMPARTDLAIPYLSVQAGRGNLPEVHRLASAMLERRADDPVGLYFMGLINVQQPGGQDLGRDQLRRSLGGGMDRLMPIDPALRRLLMP